MKKKILRSIVVLLLLIEGTFIYLSYRSYNNFSVSEVKEVNVEDILSNHNSALAIQIQNDNDNGWHEAADRNAWPSKATYTWGGAECTDSDGTKLDYHEVLSFDSNTYTATINTKKTVYCTLYFTKGKPALDVLKAHATGTGTTTFNSTNAVMEMYRYNGTSDQVTNNYICFGTNNPDTCTKTPETYMYRIIGIQATTDTNLNIPANSLKIIKASKYGGIVAWNGNTGATWDTASVNTTVLNTTFYNMISTTESGVNWQNIILSNHNWYIGDKTSAGKSETTAKTSTNKPIGLMYQSDYYNAGNRDTNNWLFIKNGWNTNPAEYEWTMSRIDGDHPWEVSTSGGLSSTKMTNTLVIRPVFYLVSDVTLYGEGTEASPFIITNKS